MPQLHNEPKVTNTQGAVQSDIGVDWTYLPWSAARAAAVCMSENALEHGGAYPKDNWRGLTLNDHLNHSMEHIYGALDPASSPEEILEHLVHLGCRAMMAIETQQVELL